jgi:hypothetical protein
MTPMKPSLLAQARERIADIQHHSPRAAGHGGFDASLIRVLQPGETLANLQSVEPMATARPLLVVPVDPLTELVEAVHAELAAPAA